MAIHHDHPRLLARARALRDDPAFSPDPRAHPHFPLASARSYRALSPLQDTPVADSSSTHTLPRKILKPALSLNTTLPRKARVKALVRRLTSRHNLDRIDELDETDPFGASYHHDGPYEATTTTTNIPQSTPPHTHSDIPPRTARGGLYRSKREFDPRSLRLDQYPSVPSVPSIHGETALSLHLEPGQILQQNAIYCMAPVPGHSRSQPATVTSLPNVVRPDRSRNQSLPNCTPSLHGSSSRDPPDTSQNRPSSGPTPEFRPRDKMQGMFDDLPRHRNCDVPPTPCQTEPSVIPGRYASSLHRSCSLRSPQPGTSHSSSRKKTRSIGNAVHAPPDHDPKHKSFHSDGPSTVSNTDTQDKPRLEPFRMRHLPKRLVMPAPLQPRPPQDKVRAPEPASIQDEYFDDHALEGVRFEWKPAMYIQEPRLLRKRSSAFPAKTPIPDHVPMCEEDAMAITGDALMDTARASEETRERTRRRRLSKRKNEG